MKQASLSSICAFMIAFPLTGMALEFGDYTYETNGDPATVTITGYIGPGGDVAIPDTIDGLPVTHIGVYAFDWEWFYRGSSSLTSVTIPDSVITLGNYAFSGSYSLTNVLIGNNVKSIGGAAFRMCESLTTVTIPSSVTNIGPGAFRECWGLTNVVIGNNVKSIEDAAFYKCYSLTSVMIPASVTNIGWGYYYGFAGFQQCTNLTSVYFAGNAPPLDPGGRPFEGAPATIHYVTGTTGWSNPWLGRPTVAHPALSSVSGNFSYSGGQTGVYVLASINNSPVTNQFVLGVSSSYSASSNSTFGTYSFFAYRDSNGNATQDDWEARGIYSNSPIFLLGNTNGINITLRDPDHDGDGYPDYLERQYGADPYDATSRIAVVRGAIAHSGGQTGIIRVMAISSFGSNMVQVSGPGAYALTNRTELMPVAFMSYRDSNGNSTQDYWEACGIYSNSPIGLTGDTNGINITLTDPDHDGDGQSDYIERLNGTDPYNPSSRVVQAQGVVSYPGSQRGTIIVVASNQMNTYIAGLPTDHLVAYYPFNGNANDVSGNGYNGDIVGATLITNRYGAPASSCSFNGVDNYVDCGIAPAFQFMESDFSIFAWVSIRNASAYSIIFSRDRSCYASSQFRLAALNDSISFVMSSYYPQESHQEEFTLFASFPTSTWFQVGIVRTGLSFQLFVNGSQKDAITLPHNISLTNAYDLLLGCRNGVTSGTYSEFFNGCIDDVTIYNRALSGEEVGYQFTSEFGIYVIPNLPTLTNYWVSAYLDSNGNGLQDYWEACGSYSYNPFYLTNAQSGINITLTDPDHDGDGQPDYVERQNGTDPYNVASRVVQILGILSGEVNQAGPIRVVAMPNSLDSSMQASNNMAYTTMVTGGCFAIQGVPTLSNYWVKAFIDSNNDGAWSPLERLGAFPENPVYLTNNFTGVNIALRYGDWDSDGLPDNEETFVLLTDPANALSPIQVDDDGPNDPGRGDPSISDPAESGTRYNPFDSIQKGVNAATNGMTVLVHDGYYTSTGNRDIQLNGKKITVRSRNGATATLIEDFTRGFICNSNETTNTVIQGFSIHTWAPFFGLEGIRIDGSSPTIRDCIIWDCGIAGVLCTNGAKPVVERCTLSGNVGGIRVFGSSPTIDRCTIVSNATDVGAGIYISGSSKPTIQNTLIANNSSSVEGGGIYIGAGSSPTNINCTIAGNTAVTRGGGVSSGGSPVFYNDIVVSNSAPANPGIYASAAMTIQYSWLQSFYPGLGNKTNNPNSVAGAGYMLMANSPAIDAGTVAFMPSVDLLGVPRPVDGDTNGAAVVDMGCYEFIPASLDSDADGVPDWWTWQYFGHLAGQGSDFSSATNTLPGSQMTTFEKYLADLNPTNPSSVLEVTGVQMLPQGIKVDWEGGQWARQYLESRQDLANTNEPWTPVFTNFPPTASATNILINAGVTNKAGFYRIRVER